MKKLLLLGLAIITALTSTGVQAFAGELHTNEEVGKCTVIDAEGKFLEELFVPVGPYEFSLNSKLQPRGATDLYYYYMMALCNGQVVNENQMGKKTLCLL